MLTLQYFSISVTASNSSVEFTVSLFVQSKLEELQLKFHHRFAVFGESVVNVKGEEIVIVCFVSCLI